MCAICLYYLSFVNPSTLFLQFVLENAAMKRNVSVEMKLDFVPSHLLSLEQ